MQRPGSAASGYECNTRRTSHSYQQQLHSSGSSYGSRFTPAAAAHERPCLQSTAATLLSNGHCPHNSAQQLICCWAQCSGGLSLNTLLLLLLLLLPGLVNEKTVDISAEGDAVKVRHSSSWVNQPAQCYSNVLQAAGQTHSSSWGHSQHSTTRLLCREQGRHTAAAGAERQKMQLHCGSSSSKGACPQQQGQLGDSIV
jgi:hypothetical protein